MYWDRYILYIYIYIYICDIKYIIVFFSLKKTVVKEKRSVHHILGIYQGFCHTHSHTWYPVSNAHCLTDLCFQKFLLLDQTLKRQ